ncbi:MAG TPA: hypothetical protein PK385_12555 [Spirochaetota bacterium]|jgi:hypothetical protein|nr:hypothetical protein [Spirochaetota bacterium]HOS33908.1 hypothetical protein [Spirochaetota bacterium]HOS56876.1 hypothetical protein [Spirochaetota bacterium]HPK62396.1 hypothetical protein [Spirochaetota bacterium]HPY88726.1 hypothetical protein [Spirochaetota bacterium]
MTSTSEINIWYHNYKDEKGNEVAFYSTKEELIILDESGDVIR